MNHKCDEWIVLAVRLWHMASSTNGVGWEIEYFPDRLFWHSLLQEVKKWAKTFYYFTEPRKKLSVLNLYKKQTFKTFKTVEQGQKKQPVGGDLDTNILKPSIETLFYKNGENIS